MKPLFHISLILVLGNQLLNAEDAPIVILGAVPQEIRLILEALDKPREDVLAGIPYTRGELYGQDTIVGVTGVGKTYSAMVTTLFLHEFQPRMAFMTGTGARINPDLQTGDVILAESVFFHDYGSMTETDIAWHYHDPSGVMANEPLRSYPAQQDFAKAWNLLQAYTPHEVTVDGKVRAVRIEKGTVTSGDLYGINARRIAKLREAQADILEMESAGFAQVCEQFGIPYLVVRAGSNQAQPTPNDDYIIYGPIAADSAARTTLHLIERWEQHL